MGPINLAAQRVRARRQRAQDAELFRLLVERVVDSAIFVLTPDGKVASWNRGAERLDGYSADEIIGASFEQFYTAEDRQADRPRQLLETARRQGRVEDHGWRVRKDGSRFPADVVITALDDSFGTPRGFAIITRDRSEPRGEAVEQRKTEARFAALVDSIKDYAIFMLSPNGTILTWNQGAQRLKGYAPEDIIGQSFARFYTDDARAAGRPALLLDIARREGRVEDEGWRVRKDGSRFWADVVITALWDADGHLEGFAKVTRDLTERRQAERDRAARIGAERAAQRIERLQVATAALAAASRPESAAEVLTDVAVRSLGASAGVVGLPGRGLELVGVRGSPFGRSDLEQIALDEPHPLTTAWRRREPLIAQSSTHIAAEYPELLDAAVPVTHAAWAVIPLMLEDRVVGVLGISFENARTLDPDERGFLLVLAEVGAQALDRARLYAAEEHARTEAEAAARLARDEAQLVETLHAVSLKLSAELDLDAVVQAATDAARSATGAAFGAFFYNIVDQEGEHYTLYTVSGAPRETFEGFPMPRNTAVFAPTFNGEGVVRSDDILQDSRYGNNAPYFGMPPGHLPVRSYLAVPVVSRAGAVLGGLFLGHPRPRMFTERAERLALGIAAQSAIAIDNARLYQQVQQDVRTRDEFLAAAAHDLKTPLASAKALAQLLRNRVQRMQIDGGDRLTDGLQRIDESVTRMTGLIDELLDLGRLQMGRLLDLERAPTDMVRLVKEAVADLQPNAPRHTFRVGASDESIVGEWDAVRLRRVLDNLVSNAVKYSPEGGDVVVRMERQITTGRPMAVFQVSDQGVGIPADDLPHIFERFRRGGNVAFIHGTGIGLGIAQSIVQQHGGSIGVESTEGQGTTFTVRLPLD